MLFALAGFAQSEIKGKSSGIRSIDFLNQSYRTDVCPGFPEIVKLRKGMIKDGEGQTININKGEVVFGDINKDGKEDAIVQLRCTTGASYRSFDIQVFTFEKGKAKLLAEVGMGDVNADFNKFYPDSIMCCAGGPPSIRDGHLIIKTLTDGMFLNPENTTTFDYKLNDGKFVLSGEPTRRKLINDEEIVYEYHGQPVNPEFQCNFTVTLNGAEAKLRYQAYGKQPTERTVKTGDAKFNEIMEVASKAEIRKEGTRENDGCDGGTSESLKIFDAKRIQTFSGYVYHCGTDYGNMTGDIILLKKKITALFPNEKYLK